VPRTELPALTITLRGTPARSSSTLGSVGAYAVVIATALPDLGLTLTSAYLSALVGDVAATHLCSAPGRDPRLCQRMLRDEQPGETHARVCLLDHTVELQAAIADLDVDEVGVAIDVPPSTLDAAAGARHDPDA
jgi:hypothetical protein